MSVNFSIIIFCFHIMEKLMDLICHAEEHYSVPVQSQMLPLVSIITLSRVPEIIVRSIKQ